MLSILNCSFIYSGPVLASPVHNVLFWDDGCAQVHGAQRRRHTHEAPRGTPGGKGVTLIYLSIFPQPDLFLNFIWLFFNLPDSVWTVANRRHGNMAELSILISPLDEKTYGITKVPAKLKPPPNHEMVWESIVCLK